MALPAALRLTLAVTLDGTPIAGFPVERRPTGANLERMQLVRQSDGVGLPLFAPAPVTQPLATMLLEARDAVQVALDAQFLEAVTLDAGGLLLLLNATVTTVHLANPTATPARCTFTGLTL